MALCVMKRPGDSMTVSVRLLVNVLVTVLVMGRTIDRNGVMS